MISIQGLCSVFKPYRHDIMDAGKIETVDMMKAMFAFLLPRKNGLARKCCAVAGAVLALVLNAGMIQAAPSPVSPHPMAYRIIWTWDFWICDPKDAQSFVVEYKRLIDFMAEWDYNGLIIWGFIDDRHGGEASAREVAEYGAQKGVRILPGVGAGGYNGFVQTKHKYNLPCFLQEHAELRAVPRSYHGNPSGGHICLYQDKSLQWLGEGSSWLAQNFAIGGVKIETLENDFIDICPFASNATKAEPNRLKYSCSFSDMAKAVDPICRAVRRQRSGAWVLYGLYDPLWWNRPEDAHLLKDIPPEAVAVWYIWDSEGKFLKAKDSDIKVPPPVSNNILLFDDVARSYSRRTSPLTFELFRCFGPQLEQIQAVAARQHGMNTQGFGVCGGPPEAPGNEIDYIAYVAFNRDPAATMEEFSRKYIAQLYGREAEPLVLQLMLKQSKVHAALKVVWQPWAALMSYGYFSADRRSWGKKLYKASEENLGALREQIVLARKAREIASPDGKIRLDKIIEVLEEYRIIGELSRQEQLRGLMEQGDKLPLADIIKAYEFIKQFAAKAGLPDEIYHYSRLK